MAENYKHKRRVRYSGTHPKKFSEKYKELNPEKYPDSITKIKAKGQTPAGMHLPICLKEICQVLQLRKGMTGIDCTLGYGGHSKKILNKILPGGNLIGLDIDKIELEKTKERFKALGITTPFFQTRQINFSQIKDCLQLNSGKFDFILADLGVSSMQLDTPERGFSFKNPAPLDLRLDNSSDFTAAQLLMQIDSEHLSNILVENADEPEAVKLADNIIKHRNDCQTTTGLAQVINETMGISASKSTIQRVFQALRIEINKEFEALDQLLSDVPECLKKNGRVAILTFHSGEDRRVKKNFKRFVEEGIYSECVRRPIRPGVQERHDNPRSSSAKLRWAEKS